MTEEHPPDAPKPIEPASLASLAESAPPEPSIGGAKLFVIFFFAIVPLLGLALLAMVIYGLFMR